MSGGGTAAYRLIITAALVAPLLCCCTAVSPMQQQMHLERAERLLERGRQDDFQQAIKAFASALEGSSGRAGVLTRIRECLFAAAERAARRGDSYGEWRCYLAYTENFDRTSSQAYVRLARVCEKRGDLPGAVYFAKKAYALDPGSPEIQELLKGLDPI
ncbi:hypothetical protein ACFL43_03385 [Thermodesulfobacteriota bacterium]